jgi:hypothetical protein
VAGVDERCEKGRSGQTSLFGHLLSAWGAVPATMQTASVRYGGWPITALDGGIHEATSHA